MVFSIYAGDDCDPVKDVQRLKTLVEGLQLLEDDYLGGLGTRGSGKVTLGNIKVRLRNGSDYLGGANPVPGTAETYENLAAFVSDLGKIQAAIQKELG
jgi:CRISPR-associated protein Csm3